MGKKLKVLGVISGIALISGFIYCIVNQNWSDAFLIAALFFIFHIMPNHLDKINKSQFMEKFFIDNGQLLTVFMSCIFMFFADNLPEFSNAYLTFITYCIILLIPVSLSIYYKNKK